MRSARFHGFFLSRPTTSRRPTTMPAWGPPRSLSPEKQTRARPAATVSGTGGSARGGPVRRPPLAQDGAAPQHDVGDPELAADLDQLAPRDDDLPAVGERLQRQEDGGGVGVGDEGVVRAREAAQEPVHVAVARAPL